MADRNTHASVRERSLSVLEEWAKDFNDADGSLGMVKETLDQLNQQGFNSVKEVSAEPQEPSSEQLRREDEELRRVLELSMQDQGGRGNFAQGPPDSAGPSCTSFRTGPQQEVASGGRPGTAAMALVDQSLPNLSRLEAQSEQQSHTHSQPRSQTQPAVVKAPLRVRALYDFTPSEVGELPFTKGDVIRVLDSVYEHWWRGELRGEAGIFPVNYVEVLPNPTPDEIRREAEQEARVFQQAANIDRLLSRLRSLEAEAQGGVSHGVTVNLAEDEELQDLYQSSLAMRPRIVRLIDRYSSKVQELRALNDKFVQARGVFDTMMERSMAVHQPGQSTGAYLGARPEYGYHHGAASSAPPQQGYNPPCLAQQQQQQQPQQQQPSNAALGPINGYSGQSQPQQQQPHVDQDPRAYAQWYEQQTQGTHRQPQPQASCQATNDVGSQQPGAYPQYQQTFQQQQQQQQPPHAAHQLSQQNIYGVTQAGSSSAMIPGASSSLSSVPQLQNPQEDEKRRLYEQARREAEAYHASYGHHTHNPSHQ